MTLRKDELPLPPRPRTFPDREGCAAECSISPNTWDAWVEAGRAPPPVPGSEDGTPRWCWADVVTWMTRPAERAAILARYAGETVADDAPTGNVDRFALAAGQLAHAPQKERRRGSAL